MSDPRVTGSERNNQSTISSISTYEKQSNISQQEHASSEYSLKTETKFTSETQPPPAQLIRPFSSSPPDGVADENEEMSETKVILGVIKELSLDVESAELDSVPTRSPAPLRVADKPNSFVGMEK